ncbi:MAG: threonylcarbamoyl-AMP synthase [Candidatus Ancillula sp.]|jgi:tRNA threonylcarbamoyl adenosine modification protein (Sua5/YciO/YrdC/YwlC family)|nr:threonylcarbamoyl-AMP synthase [Candidatus Ancillula sp.]
MKKKHTHDGSSGIEETELIEIHPVDPQERLVSKVVEQLNSGAVIAYPTSSGYALGCKIDDTNAIERIRTIRDLQEKQDWTLMTASISQASQYAKIGNREFKFLKSVDPAGFTFIFKTMPELPKKTNSKRGTVGIRIAANKVTQSILEELGEPIISTSLLLPTEEEKDKGQKYHKSYASDANMLSFTNGFDVQQALDKRIELVIGAGEVPANSTTILDLTEYSQTGEYVVLRQGLGVI